MNSLFIFFTMAFPKAGAVIAGVPITVATVLFILPVFRSLKSYTVVKTKYSKLLIKYIVFIILVSVITLINIPNASSFNITVSIVLLLSPLTFLLSENINIEKAFKILFYSLLIVGIYSLAQWFIGIERTTIYGLNVAFGDSLFSKPLAWGQGGREALKMPSTYQNGNLVALFPIIGVAVLSRYKFQSNNYNKLKIFPYITGLASILLSGSRATIVPVMVIALTYLIYSIFRRKMHYMTWFLIIVIPLSVLLYAVIFESELILQFLYRNITTTLNDPTGVGRVPAWENMIRDFFGGGVAQTVARLLFGVPWDEAFPVEGFLYLLSLYGLPVMICFIALLISIMRQIYKHSLLVFCAFLCVFLAFSIDMSFLFPPSLMNLFLIAGMFLKNEEYQTNKSRNFAETRDDNINRVDIPLTNIKSQNT